MDPSSLLVRGEICLSNFMSSLKMKQRKFEIQTSSNFSRFESRESIFKQIAMICWLKATCRRRIGKRRSMDSILWYFRKCTLLFLSWGSTNFSWVSASLSPISWCHPCPKFRIQSGWPNSWDLSVDVGRKRTSEWILTRSLGTLARLDAPVVCSSASLVRMTATWGGCISTYSS